MLCIINYLLFFRTSLSWLVRNEMPRTLEDVLARRLRILFLDARAAMAMAPKVAGILATEWGKDETWTSAQVKALHAYSYKRLYYRALPNPW